MMPALEDFLHPLKSAYRRSPQWFKNSVGSLYAQIPYAVRYGGELRRMADFLQKSQYWNREELEDYQWAQLKALLDHAYANVPYYRRTWAEHGVSPADIQSFTDMRKLPLLSKDQVRQHKEELIAENYRNKLLKTNTGGSTGQPLELYWERGRSRAAERAFMWRQWRWAGFEYGQRTAILRGQTVSGRIHYDPIDRHLFLSGFDLKDDTAPQYLEALRNFRPVSIQAYPSTITVLGNYMYRHHEPPISSVKVVLAGSENLYPTQRALLERAFACRVYSWYGHGEITTLAGGCEVSDAYHVYNEYGYTELIDANDNVLSWKPGIRGEIIGSSFLNWAMPLIRYRTADVAVVGPTSCACGRHYPLWERIEGRKQEYIVASDGKLIALTAFIFGQHYHAFEKITRLQIVQNEPGAIMLRLIVNTDWTAADEADLRHDMAQVLASDWQIDFEYVEHIPLTNVGKHRFVIQNIPLSDVWSGTLSDEDH